MKSSLWLLPIALLLLTGCSNSTPSESAVHAMIKQQVATESQGSLKLLSFEKVNGQKADLGGIEIYTFDYKGVIEFQDEGWWVAPGTGWDGHFFVPHGNPSPTEEMMPQYIGRVQRPKGWHVNITATLQFDKTERGWRSENGKLLGSKMDPAIVKLVACKERVTNGEK